MLSVLLALKEKSAIIRIKRGLFSFADKYTSISNPHENLSKLLHKELVLPPLNSHETVHTIVNFSIT